MMTPSDSTLSTVATIVATLIRCDAASLNPDEDLLQSGKLTSLTSLNILIELENTFGFKIPNSELNRRNFSTLRSLATLVDRIQNQ